MKRHLVCTLAALCLVESAPAQLTSEALWKSYAAAPQGAARSDTVRDSVPGEKGSVIADEGKVPAIPNLYQAQLRQRLGR